MAEDVYMHRALTEGLLTVDPIIVDVIDENGEISELEGFRGDGYSDNFRTHLKQQNGIVVVEV